MTSLTKAIHAGTTTIGKGDAIYARSGANKTFAWYVLDSDTNIFPDGIYAYAHRYGGAGKIKYMNFADVRLIERRVTRPDGVSYYNRDQRLGKSV